MRSEAEVYDLDTLLMRCRKSFDKNCIKLHLGCGQNLLNGYVNIDFPSDAHNLINVEPDVSCDVKLLRCNVGSIDEIRLHHVFEHFSRVIAISMLIRWHIWLKLGGILWIETPDFIGTARTILSSSDWKVVMGGIRHLAGDQAADWAYHVDHWFEARFLHTLPKLGFNVVSSESSKWPHSPYLCNISIVAQKCSNMSLGYLIDTADELLLESMVSDTEIKMHQIWKSALHEELASIGYYGCVDNDLQ